MIWGFLALISPFLALVLWFVPQLVDSQVWDRPLSGIFYVFSQFFLFAVVVLGLNLHLNRVQVPKLTYWIWLYALFLMFYLLFFVHKWGVRNVHKALAVGILAVFIAADVWELPIFVYGGLGMVPAYAPWVGGWSDQIHRVYVVAVAFILARLLRFRFKLAYFDVLVMAFVGPWFFLLVPGWLTGLLARWWVLQWVGFFIMKAGAELYVFDIEKKWRKKR